MVVFQVKVLQVSLIRNFIYDVAESSSPSGFLLKIETSSDRSREFPGTFRSSGADGSRQTGGPFSSSSLCRNCAFCGRFTLFFHQFLS